MTSAGSDRQRVAIVTGGGAGIGAAIAKELGRSGTFVITMDPLVSVDGAEQLPSPEETTAGRIAAAGGSARSSATSVTDRSAVEQLFADVAEEFGGLDVVVNVAGITRPTSFARGTDQDWLAVLAVHLDGYRNVLGAALPLMAAAGRGHILGVTSGSGWRAADTGAYGCAKRAVASLTWQIGRQAPAGVFVNAISPIAMTRMVTAALSRASATAAAAPKDSTPPEAAGARSSVTGGLSLGSMPAPDELGPFAAHLVGRDFSACRGQVLFAAGSEVAVVAGPRLVERFDAAGVGDLAAALEVITPTSLVPAETGQHSGGGSNPRFAALMGSATPAPVPAPVVGSCLVVAGAGGVGDAVIAALDARGVACHRVPADAETTFEGAAAALASFRSDVVVDAIAVARTGVTAPPPASIDGWERTLDGHTEIVAGIAGDAAWARAAADHAARIGRPVRLVTLTDATGAAGRTRAQAAAQLARAARRATKEQVLAFSVGIETTDPASVSVTGALAAHLLCSPETPGLSGAELVVDTGSVGLRSHPSVAASLVIGHGPVPSWLDATLTDLAGQGGPA
jgi:NAD(P)-dependent dehydrogenase (short-subunit alcohol dehydrogenase family)